MATIHRLPTTRQEPRYEYVWECELNHKQHCETYPNPDPFCEIVHTCCRPVQVRRLIGHPSPPVEVSRQSRSKPQEEVASQPPPEALPICPHLPKEAVLDPALGIDACRWLDTYIAFSQKWSPEAFDEARELSGLWALSTIAARRVHIPFGPRGQYTNLTFALVARTTLHTKSTAANLAKDVIRSVGLTFLLGPDKTTPEKMLSDMAGRFDLTNYEKWSAEDKEYMQKRLAFSGQRGWYAEEFGTHLKAMQQDSGPYAALYGLMLIADDCPDKYSASTIGRGENQVDKPYFPVLANMTPANLKKGGKQGADIWQDGYFARFGFGTPSGELQEGEYPEEEYHVPNALREPLKHWHETLGTPSVTIEPEYDTKGKKIINHQAIVSPLPVQRCIIDKDVRDALYRYRRALRRMVAESRQEDTDGNYGRFSTLALRIAGLFASLENNGHIQLRHYARAQTITERMRASLHRLIVQINEATAAPSYARKAENTIVEIIRKLEQKGKPTTLREIYSYANISALDAKLQVQNLVELGILEEVKGSRTSTYRLVAQ